MKQGTREQGNEGTHGRDQVERLLQQAMPPMGDRAELAWDLWPAMRSRLREPQTGAAIKAVPWFDWALAGGVALFAVTVPAAVPVLLYYL